jgi:hypothetical protein
MKKILLSLMLLLPMLAAAQTQTRPTSLNPVIAVMDLQILYRDYDNRIEVAVPGITNPNDLTIECPEASIKQVAGSWSVRPNANAKNCNIAVYATIKGQKTNVGTREFRVLPLPKPEGYFAYRDKKMYESGSSIPKSILMNENSCVIADYGSGALLRKSFKVTEFKVVINGIAIDCKGATFSNETRDRISKLQRGSKILITDIKAQAADEQTVQLKPINLIVG